MNTIIVGAGTRGREHALGISDAIGLELVGVVDMNRSAAAETAEAAACVPYGSLSECFAAEAVEYVVLAAPPQVRLVALKEICAESSVRAVTVEKPMALTLAEAREMLELADRSNTLLLVSHQLRYSPEFEMAHDAVRSGKVGAVEFLRAVSYGNLWNQGPHLVDAMRWFADQEVKWVLSDGSDDSRLLAPLSTDMLGYWRDPDHDGPMWSTHTLGFDDGVQAAVQTGILFEKTQPDRGPWLQKRVTVQGATGTADARVAGYCRVCSDEADNLSESFTVADYERATTRFHEAVLAALDGKGKHRCDAHDAIRSLEVLLACDRSLARKELVTLPLADSKTTADIDADEPDPLAVQKVSVIIAIPDHRGYAEACVRSWTQEQTANADHFEVILINDGTSPELDKGLQRLLRDGDQLIVHPTDCEMELYSVGAKAAAGDVIFFAEPHCVAEREAMDELIFYLEHHDVDGCCIRSTPICDNRLAWMESRMYDEGFLEWSKPDSWCKVIIRGFALRRPVHDAVGGFNHRYIRFSEWLMAADLHRLGYRLGYAPGPSVKHLYTDTLTLLKPFIRTFTEGECIYRREAEGARVFRYFGHPSEWGRDNLLNPGLTRQMARHLRSRSRLFLRYGHSFRTRTSAFRNSLYYRWMSLFGRHALRAVARWRSRLAAMRTHFWRWFSEDRCYQAYIDFYMSYTSRVRVEYMVDHPAPASAVNPGDTHAFADLPNSALIGFYGPEEAEEQRFRWSAMIGGICLDLEPKDYRIEVRAVCRDLTACGVNLYLNDQVLSDQQVDLSPEKIEIRLSSDQVSDRENWLYFQCMPMYGKEDPREFGLALASIASHRV